MKGKIEDMKIIDLLNKIANGEEVPKKIKYNEEEYIYESIPKDYTKIDRYGWLSDYIVNDGFGRFLNDEVEILETTINTKNMNITSSEIKPSTYTIEKLELPRYFNEGDGETFTLLLNLNENVVAIKNKINEIIDEINKEVK